MVTPRLPLCLVIPLLTIITSTLTQFNPDDFSLNLNNNLQLRNTKWTNTNVSHQAPLLSFSLKFNAPQFKSLSVKSSLGIWHIRTSSQNGPNCTLKLARQLPAIDALEYQFTWPKVSLAGNEKVCFYFSAENISWYPLFFEPTANWPLSPDFKNNNPHQGNPKSSIPIGTTFSDDNIIGPLVEPILINSGGFAIIFDDLHPWSIDKGFEAVPSAKDPKLCFGLTSTLPGEHHSDYYSRLKFRILTSANITALHQNLIQLGYIKRPGKLPDNRFFSLPLWSQQTIEYLADPKSPSEGLNELLLQLEKQKLFQVGTLIDLDPKWQKVQGDLTFNKAAYPPSFLQKLSIQSNLSLALPLGPHFDHDSEWAKNHFPADIRGGTFDLSDDRQRTQFISKLTKLQKQYNIESYKLTKVVTSSSNDPDEIIRKYGSFTATHFTRTMADFSSSNTYLTGYKSQAVAAFLRFEVDVVEVDDDDNSVKQLAEHCINAFRVLFTRALTASMAGYGFIAPEFIGKYPSKLPYWHPRWLKAAALLPGMYLSLPSWDLEQPNELRSRLQILTTNIIALRRKFAVHMLKLATAWIHKGEPIVRPMWYAEPENIQTYSIWNQFMLGPDIVVAPQTDLKLESQRYVYLPPGSWFRVCIKRNILPGGRNISVLFSEKELPIFVRRGVDNPFDELPCQLDFDGA